MNEPDSAIDASFALISSELLLEARGKSTIDRAHRACEASSRREEESDAAQSKRCDKDIVEDEQRRNCPQSLCIQWVPTAQQHLPLHRPVRGLLYFHNGFLDKLLENLIGQKHPVRGKSDGRAFPFNEAFIPKFP